MSLIKYNSVVNDFVPTSFSNVIDRFFNESVARTGGSSAYSFVPKVDVFEDENAFEVQVAVPGMNKEDFKIDINEDRLTISGERKYSKERKENNFRSIETSYGSFSRTFTLPDNIDVNKIEATYNNGILELTLPKDEKKVVKTSIRIK
ncbi:MAG: Hsp20/alpha crystallin family protein [Cyclobacteriaceae bacterium]|jgi:HSP20 family protein|nr:Hsp20/alpha crystallin family protein [Cyclobacteriaceae bacterium]NBP70503.1 Hsp20/alpha crystallin family protein [Cytophagia bacterium]NBW37868.1 Hsp20/alpha crystallin family protein [Cytophagia bacterium]